MFCGPALELDVSVELVAAKLEVRSGGQGVREREVGMGMAGTRHQSG